VVGWVSIAPQELQGERKPIRGRARRAYRRTVKIHLSLLLKHRRQEVLRIQETDPAGWHLGWVIDGERIGQWCDSGLPR